MIGDGLAQLILVGAFWIAFLLVLVIVNLIKKLLFAARPDTDDTSGE